MKGFLLTEEEIDELRVAHKSSASKKDSYKINTIVLLGSCWSLDEVSEALLLDDETLRSYANDYRSGGLPTLLKTNYKGSQKKLSEEQIEKLCVELDEHIYVATKGICAWIEREFEIQYTISGITDLLHQIGYVYKKPKLVPSNPDTDAQEIFLEQFNAFMKNKPANEAVFFVDAVHPVHNTVAGYGWIKKGKDKELKSNTGRSRFNVHGAMNAETLETTVVVSEDSVNSESTINLFEYLEMTYPLAVVIYVILDNARYHFSEPVQAWLKNSRVKAIFLPAYSPELNLIERLWKIFKKHVLYNQYYETFAEFKKSCIDFFKNQENHYEEISSIMGDGLEGVSVA